MKRRLSVTNFSTCRLYAPVVIRVKVKRCEQTLLFVAMHYWGYTSLEVRGRWGLFLPPCLLITAIQQPGTSSPPSRLKRSSEGVIWMCRASSTPSQWGQADHQVHCGAGRRQNTPVSRHATQKERGWQPRRLYLQEAHAHGLLSPLWVPSSDPREERCGEMSP